MKMEFKILQRPLESDLLFENKVSLTAISLFILTFIVIPKSANTVFILPRILILVSIILYIFLRKPEKKLKD